MNGYVLTDRGKIVLAVILVVLIFFLPAVILIFSAIASPPPKAPDSEKPQASAAPPALPDEPPPVITKSPPPDGGGFNPSGMLPPTDGDPDEQGTTDGQAPSPAPGSGQGNADPIDGTLSFRFSPHFFEKLDAGTSALFDVFLSSHKNTRDSVIAVETPELTDEIKGVFIPFIVDAFVSKGVDESRIEYITDPGVPLSDEFEVVLYYISRGTK